MKFIVKQFLFCILFSLIPTFITLAKDSEDDGVQLCIGLRGTVSKPIFFLGPILEYSSFSYPSYFKSNSEYQPNGITNKSSGSGFTLGMNTAVLIGEPWNSTKSITFSLNYESKNIELSQSIIDPRLNNKLLNLVGRESDSSKIALKFNSQTKMKYITFDALYNQELFQSAFMLITGISFGVNLSNNTSQNLSIDNGDKTLLFQNKQSLNIDPSFRNVTIYDGKTQNFSSLICTVKVGFGYEIWGKNWQLTPYILSGFNLFSTQQNENMREVSVHFGLNFRYGLRF